MSARTVLKWDYAAVREDYEYMVRHGETHPEMIAARIGVPSIAGLDILLRRAYGRHVPCGTIPELVAA